MKNPRTRLILILGLVLVLAVIAILPSLLATPTPAVTAPPTRVSASPVARVSQTPGNAFVTPVSAAPTASGVSKPSTVSSFKVTPAPSLIPAGSTQTPLPAATPTAPAIATGATAQPTPIVAAATPVPAPTMTQEEQEVVGNVLSSSPQFTSSPGECDRILKTEPWCSLVQSAKHITRPEWEELFPQAKFFLVKRKALGRESGLQQNLLVIEQAGQQYDADSFQRLLDANDIVITDTNRELVAKALVLMKLMDYLEADIVFSDWGTTDQPAPFDLRYNYTLTAWTKVQGLKFEWVFFFYEGSLITARGGIREQNVGDYIDVPFDVLPLPTLNTLEYWSK